MGERFEAIVTGASPKGVSVRRLSLLVEGMLVLGFDQMNDGHCLRVQLISVESEQGFIDFKKVP